MYPNEATAASGEAGETEGVSAGEGCGEYAEEGSCHHMEEEEFEGFYISKDGRIPSADILNSLFSKKHEPTLNLSTVPVSYRRLYFFLFFSRPVPSLLTVYDIVQQRVSATSFLHEVDRVLQDIETSILDSIAGGACIGDEVVVPHTSSKIHLSSKIARPTIRRWKRSFLDITKANASSDIKKIGSFFVDYLNTQLSHS